ncbi:MAG TPA: hypothetical protein VFA87_07470 [Rhizomicrobium sp.]|nr:hypothetical protein [Rhizomicrobium sp.]
MVWILVLVTVAHVLAGVFWAGTTAALARSGAISLEILAFPQIGAAVVAILLGASLWGFNHHAGADLGDHILGIGALCALAALAVQVTALGRVRALRVAPEDEKPALRRPLALRQRIAAVLLSVTIAAMVSWRYF